MKFILFCFTAFLTSTGYSQCTLSGNSLVTSYVSNNSNKGEMFDIAAINTITLLCFDLNLILGSIGPYEIYYKVGSYVGSENNAAAWTLIGSNPSVPCVGFDFPSPLNIPLNIVVPAGQTYGFYVTGSNVSSSAGIRYTNNAGYTTVATNSDLSILGGIGKAYPFLTNYPNRSFNGTVYYELGNVLPVELSGFWATPLNGAVRISWETQSEVNNDHFNVQRSADAENWETIETMKGAGNTTVPTTYDMMDEAPLSGISYYRLVQTDFDGRTKFHDPRSVNRENKLAKTEELIAFPNPATAVITLQGSPDELGEIGVYSICGENLLTRVGITHYHSHVTIDLSQLSSQLIVVHAGQRSVLVVH